jgi:hypothetical protein
MLSTSFGKLTRMAIDGPSVCAGLSYFYLCRVWNSTGRSISFRRLTTVICAELMISKPTLERHRNVLKQYGMIEFISKGKGDQNISYKTLELRNSPEEVKKEYNITSPVTSPVTSADAYYINGVRVKRKSYL